MSSIISFINYSLLANVHTNKALLSGFPRGFGKNPTSDLSDYRASGEGVWSASAGAET
jgi:hypothetical protein